MSERSSQCVVIEADLVASATGEAGARAVQRVRGHVERCRSCRDELERYRALEGEVATMRGRPVAAASAAASLGRVTSRLADLRRRLLTYRIFPSPFGHLLIACSEEGVALVEYLGRHTSFRTSRLHEIPGVEAVEGDGEVDALYEELREYLAGRRAEFTGPVDLRLVRSEFYRGVLQATAAIPYGAVTSYAELARKVGRPRAVRAAAQALRWNPLPIVIPCHRVVGSSGWLTGYAGGTTGRKQKLLTVEGIPTVPGQGDFKIARNAMYVLYPGDYEQEYCVPTCSSIPDLSRARLFFGSRERAEAVGLRPCETCRPDLHPLPR